MQESLQLDQDFIHTSFRCKPKQRSAFQQFYVVMALFLKLKSGAPVAAAVQTGFSF